MAKIFKTTETEKHYHAVYMDEVANTFLTSLDNNHRHEVVIYPDPSTNEPRVAFSEVNGHTHSLALLDDVLPDKPEKKEDNEVVTEAISLFKAASRLEEDSRARGIQSYKFFKGEQWDETTKQRLKAKNRACQTHNLIASQIDILSGIARQNRLDARAFPVEGSDDGVADIATALLIRISKISKLPTHEIRVFEDGLITGRGFFDVFISQKKNPLGEIQISRFPWKDGYFGPHEELDGSDASHCHKAKWMTLSKAKRKYPEKAKDIENSYVRANRYPEDGEITTDFYVDDSESINKYNTDAEIIDVQHKRIRLIEHEIKEYRTAYMAINSALTLNQEVSLEIYNKLKTVEPVSLLRLPRERVRVVLTAGTTLIKNVYPDRPYEGFSLTPYYVYKYDDDEGFNGKVEFMKDSQREVNKRSSQIIDVANTTLSPGFFYEKDTFVNEKGKRDFQKNASTPGHNAEIENIERPPIPKQNPRFPGELFTLQQNNMRLMTSVSNINPALAGQSSQYQSAKAGSMQRQAGLIGNERVFDNFILSKQTVMHKVFKLAQEFYSKERIARIILSEASDPERLEQLQIGGQQIAQRRTSEEDAIAMQNIIKLLNTSDLSDYDITIGEQPLSPTMKEFERKSWMEAQQMGIPVPPQLMVELSSLPNKSKWAKIMQQMAEEQKQMEQLKFQTEMQKAGRLPAQNINQGGSQ